RRQGDDPVQAERSTAGGHPDGCRPAAAPQAAQQVGRHPVPRLIRFGPHGDPGILHGVSSESSDRSFRCACVQFDVRRGEVAHNLARVEAGLRAAAAQGARLAVLPEMWTTSFGTLDEPTYRESAAAEETVTRLSAELGLAVVGSAPFRDGDATYNRATVVDHGTLLGEFRKIHLFSLNAEQRFHAAGTEPLVVDTPFARL